METPQSTSSPERPRRILGYDRLALGVALWLTALTFFVVVAVLAGLYDRFPGDESITDAFQGIDVPVLGGFLAFVNVLGDAWFYIILSLSLMLLLALLQAGTAAVLVLFAAFLPWLANTALKEWIARPRPSEDLVQVTADASGFSFPSGHTLGTAGLFTVLFFVIPTIVSHRALRWTLQFGCLLAVFAAGPARVYVGVHWPSDAFGGYLLALLFVVPALVLYRALRT